MPTATPSFESRQYWDTRFTRSPQSFDWLVSPSVLIPPLLTTLSHDDNASPNSIPLILHIGCGTSNLSNLLRLHAPPSTITNVDFSYRAIELGIQREREEFAEAGTEHGKRSMSWATADLLDWRSIQSVIGSNAGDSMPPISDSSELELGDSMPSSSTCNAKFLIVIEKSCADAIACGEDVTIPVPYRLNPVVSRTEAVDEVVFIHPVCLLAIHLAALTKPGGMWIALSYSETRFDCLYSLEGGDDKYHELKRDGTVPDPAILWSIFKKQEMISQLESSDGSVHRPRISHWLYMLRRTDYGVA